MTPIMSYPVFRRRLNNDAASCIVDGFDSVLDTDMPFVNRHEELWQLFRVNADNLSKIVKHEEDAIDNFRRYHLLFCAQYFGAGKTALGKHFPEKVKDNDVKETFANKLGDCNDGLKSEWKIIQEQGIRRLLIDVRAEPNIILKAAIVASNDSNVDIRKSPEVAAQHLIKYAADNGPTLFHFDEVGADEEHDLNKLRRLAIAVWTQIHGICRKRGPDEMPRVYFLVTGQSIEPFADVGSGSTGMGSYFLVLDMLAAEHVHQLRCHLQDGDKVKNPLRLVSLDEERDGDHLNKCLARATGGAPRLLLYTLRALHFSKASLGSTGEIDAVVMETVFSLLHGIDVVASEFLPTSSSLKAFQLLLAFSLQQTKLKLSTEVNVDGKKTTQLGHILRAQPFFLSRDGCSDNQFVLHLPLYHLQAAKKKFGSDAASMLLISMAGATISANKAWRVFELLPAQLMATKAAMSHRMQSTQILSWSKALPGLLGSSELAKIAKFDLGFQPFIVHHEKGKCPAVIENGPEKYVGLGGSVLPSDKSQSADLFHVQRRMDGNGHVLIEWQSKFFLSDGLKMSAVRDEVGKAAKTLDTVHVIYATTVDKQLIGAMPETKVLTLRSWDRKTAAVFAFPHVKSSTLLWRPKTCKPDDQWYEFPAQERKSEISITAGATVVEVRAGLEVVIPHHDAVKSLIGDALFDSLVALSKGDGDDNSTAIGAVVMTLDETLGSKQKHEMKRIHKHEPKSDYGEIKTELEKAEIKLNEAETKLKEARDALYELKKGASI